MKKEELQILKKKLEEMGWKEGMRFVMERTAPSGMQMRINLQKEPLFDLINDENIIIMGELAGGIIENTKPFKEAYDLVFGQKEDDNLLEQPEKQKVSGEKEADKPKPPSKGICENCGKEVAIGVLATTERKHGMKLCMECNKQADMSKRGNKKPEKQQELPAKRENNTPTHEKGSNMGMREVGEVSHKVIGGVYRVRGKEIEDAWTTQQFANYAKLSTMINESEQNQKWAWAKVRVIAPDGQYVEDEVFHDFETTKEVMMLDMIQEYKRRGERMIDGYDEYGKPILVPQAQQELYIRFTRFKNFSLRDAVTKATRRAQLKLLNKEYREYEEIAAEEAEVAGVNY